MSAICGGNAIRSEPPVSSYSLYIIQVLSYYEGFYCKWHLHHYIRSAGALGTGNPISFRWIRMAFPRSCHLYNYTFIRMCSGQLQIQQVLSISYSYCLRSRDISQFSHCYFCYFNALLILINITANWNIGNK